MSLAWCFLWKSKSIFGIQKTMRFNPLSLVFGWVLLYSVTVFGGTGSEAVATKTPEALQGIGVTEHLGVDVQIDRLTFFDEQGKQVLLSKYFRSNKPVILTLVYFECPRLCTLVLNGLLKSLKKFDWTAGNQFELVTVSINPRDTPGLAEKKKALYIQSYGRPEASKGWHFLTGAEDQIQALAAQIGFKYRYDKAEDQYIHSANIFVLTPEGKISRYLYGIDFPEKDLRFSLIDASHGKVGSIAERVLLFCFHFDPDKNSYAFQMWRVVQIVLTLQVVFLLVFFYRLWKKEPKKTL